MKITFFKNESHFYPRVSYNWENADVPGDASKMPINYSAFRRVWGILFTIALYLTLVAVVNNGTNWAVQLALVLGIWLVCLPIHELCHALFCVIARKKVDRICFFPYQWRFLTGQLAAYVKPSFSAWSKTQLLLLSAFPFILLTCFPLVLSIFFPQIRSCLILLSVYNASCSCKDVYDIISLFQMPQNTVFFLDFSLIARDESKPIIIHKLFVTLNFDKIHHVQFTYFKGKLEEIGNVEDTPETEQLRREFTEQFGCF